MLVAKASLACLLAAAALFGVLYADPPYPVWLGWFVALAASAVLGLAGLVYAAAGRSIAGSRRLLIAGLSLPGLIGFSLVIWVLVTAIRRFGD